MIEQIDWSLLTLNIRQKMPLNKASKKLGFDTDYLNRFARNEVNEPKFSKGIAMLNLHLDLCGHEKHKQLIKKG